MRSVLNDEERLKEIVKDSLSKAEVLRKFNLQPLGGNYKQFDKYVQLFNIDTSHFTGQAWNVGKRFKPFHKNKKIPIKNLLKENVFYSTSKLKKRIIAEGFKKEQCEKCLLTEWMGQKIPLELNHINGVNSDNRIENLEIVCPNCHAQTDHYRGSSKKENKILKDRNKRIKNFKPFKQDEKEVLEEILKKAKNKHTKISFCKNCKKAYKGHERIFCSIDCYRQYSAKGIPTSEEIFDAFKKHKSFVQVAKYFNVSDNAVRKWCVKYQILEMIGAI